MVVHPVPGELERERPRRTSAHGKEQVKRPALPAERVLQLQRAAGNQAVARLLQRRRRLVGNARTVQPLGSQGKVAAELGARLATSRPRLQRVAIKRLLWKAGLEPEDKERLDNILDGATKTEELSVEQIQALIDLYEGAGVTAQVNDLRKLLDQKTGKVAEAKEPEPESEEERKKRETRLLEEGMDKLGGQKPWAELVPKIVEWWQSFKKREEEETFNRAFTANRMTARQIDLGGRGGTFQVDTPGKTPGRFMSLARGPKGIEERLKPSNFLSGQESEKGLHDLSASLLDGTLPIYPQLKHYENSVVLFMPVPEEDDLKIFAALNQLPDRDEAVLRAMGAQMTLLKLAQASDMGTTFADLSDAGGPDKFRYGHTGTIIRAKGAIGRPATPAEIKARATNALEYKKILAAGITIVNEVVMAYRQHASKLFPMYGRWDEKDKVFHVLTKDLKPIGYRITNDGRLEKGSVLPVIREGLVEPQENLRRERYLWDYQAYVALHQDDEEALRDLLTSIGREHRKELKAAYTDKVFLGAKVSPNTTRAVLQIIDDIEYDIALGHRHLRV